MTKYLVKKHDKGLAVVTWCVDDFFERENPDTVYYMIFIDVYDQESVVVFEDCLGSVEIDVPENSIKFPLAIEVEYEYHFYK